MINNNKILTVSYGTFSCTLEGFDDSFGTMKAIAEYFRDLAADDRYFGAEPPQPDAQMLARIAQREISRHVEAREDEGRIVLSAQETARAATLAPAALDTMAPEARQAQPEATQEAPHAEDDSVAQAPVAKAAPQDAAPAEEPVMSSDARIEVESEPAQPEAEAPVTAAPQVSAQAPSAEIVPSVPDTAVESFFADAQGDEPAADDFEFEDMPDPAPAATDSIADKLKRIRAVVSQQADADEAPAYTEDEHADADLPMTAIDSVIADTDIADTDIADTGIAEAEEAGEDENDVVTATLRDIEDALDADDALELAESPDIDEGEEADDDVAALLTRLEAESDAPVADDADLTGGDTLDDDALTGNILASMDGEREDADEDDIPEEMAQDDSAALDAAAPEDDADLDETEEDAAPVVPRTRVLKVKRATLDAAILAGKLEEVEQSAEEAIAIPKAPLADRSSLSEEAEAELARELAELEAEIGMTDAAEDDDDDAKDELSQLLAQADLGTDEDAAEERSEDDQVEDHASAEDDFSRLMDEADSQMDEPESATRRDAFAHLRAAVAAKKADEAVGTATSDEETDEVYRDDLASVVRPRRPRASGQRTERPEDQRPAPLKLVAEQRIDIDQSVARAPVRPRRVAAVVDNTTIETSEGVTSFEHFAQDVGAVGLPDLLEAAAAYLSFVEGHQQFSRPQLMTKVRMVEKDSFTREDGLRSFGKLLREGKIEKIKGGRFQVSEQIGFKPDARAAG